MDRCSLTILTAPSHSLSYYHRLGNVGFTHHSLGFHNAEPRHKTTMSTFTYPNATQGVETWVITITSFNLLSAVLVSCLVLLDNRHTGASRWKLRPECRTPIYLAVSIFVSNVIFCVREVEGIIVSRPVPNGETMSPIMPSCAAFNEGSWWGNSSLHLFY